MKILILHLSDLHISTGENPGLQKFAYLAQAIKNVDPDIVGIVLVFSGDLVWSAKSEEYALFNEHLMQFRTLLQSKTRNDDVFLVAVPGNHDCQFDENNTARDLIIQGLIKDPTITIDPSITELGSKVQDNFFSFRSSFTTPPTRTEGRVYYEYLWTKDNRSILFRCYNTAWLSQLKEQQGHLIYPSQFLGKCEPNTPSDFVVSVFHHPYNWLTSTCAREFKDHIEKTSDLILTGHEHEADHYLKYTFRGEVTEYVEGAVFQEASRPDRSGFNVILVDLETQRQKLLTYYWDETFYAPNDVSGGWIPYSRGRRKAKKDFDFSLETQAWLEDPGVQFNHPAKSDLKLTDIFVFPNLREYKSTERSESAIGGLLDGEDFLTVLGSKRRVLILGRQQAGKTSLAKVIFRNAYNKGLTPVYLRGDDLSSSVDPEGFYTAVRKAFQRQYSNPPLPLFDQLDRDKTLVVLDDFDHTRLNAKGRLKLLRGIHPRFERLCILGDEALKFEEVAYTELSASILSDYAQYELMEFGYFLRSKLIDQWYNVGSEYTANPEDLARKSIHAEGLITDLLGRSYLPAIPIFILSFLQALDSSSPVNTAAGSYGSLYEVLIVRALATKTKQFGLDLKMTYLAELAYWMYSTSKQQITDEEWEYFHGIYCQHFKISPSREDLNKDLVKSGLLEQVLGHFRFRHSYAYYYFVARYLRDNIHKDET